MIRALLRSLPVFVTVILAASSVRACPLCQAETGERVRAGIFSADFGYNLFVTLLPFPVFLGLVAVIHSGFPRARSIPRPTGPSEAKGTRDDRSPA